MLPSITMEARVVADPELRFAQTGTAVCKFRAVASSRKKDPDTGDWKDDKQCWLDVTCFKALAEGVAEKVVKGSLVLVSGRLVTEEWETRDTHEKRSKVAVLADSVGPALTFGVRDGVQRSSGPAADDPWASAPPAPPAGGDEPPF